MSHGLLQWGFGEHVQRALEASGRPLPGLGRVIAEHAGLYRVATSEAIRLARPTGKLRARLDREVSLRPVVGDWVWLSAINAHGESSLGEVLPRRTFISRKDPDNQTLQPIVSNVDKVFVVTSITGDLNPRRLERYLATVYESGATPVVVLTKTDLVPDAPERIVEALREYTGAVPVYAVSPQRGDGLEALEAELVPGVTVALMGSSGVGKSTLINRWLGGGQLAVAEVDELGRGRHTTTSRQLLRLPSGALVIDTPGMRELGLWDASEGVGATFPDIEALAERCRFRDCTHLSEPGCAVQAAAEEGTLDQGRLDSYLKLQGELGRQRARADELKRAQKKAPERSPSRGGLKRRK